MTVAELKAVELGSAVMHAVSKVGEKWGDRDQLVDGSTYTVNAMLAGEVNGHAFQCPIAATLTVGHESQSAPSHLPESAMLTRALAKMNAQTRAAFLAEMQTEYKETGTITANDEMVDIIDNVKSAMRKTQQVTKRGQVRVNTSAKSSPIVVSEAA